MGEIDLFKVDWLTARRVLKNRDMRIIRIPHDSPYVSSPRYGHWSPSSDVDQAYLLWQDLLQHGYSITLAAITSLDFTAFAYNDGELRATTRQYGLPLTLSVLALQAVGVPQRKYMR